jgi:hypothetical protein
MRKIFFIIAEKLMKRENLLTGEGRRGKELIRGTARKPGPI